MNTTKDDTTPWDARRNKIYSRIGGARIGEGKVTSHGYSILSELAGRASFFQMLALNVTGKLPEQRFGKWMEATFICLSWPDSRIWCNGVSALAGVSKTSPVAGVMAGVLASDSRMYGPGTSKAVCESISEGIRFRKAGVGLSEIIGRLNQNPKGRVPKIPGFSRPLATGDERVPVMHRIANELDYEIGDHLCLAYDMNEILLRDYGESINYSGYIGAFLTDLGYTPDQVYRLYSTCVSAGVHACYRDTFDDNQESFLPLRCEDVEYLGKKPREVPFL